MYLDSDCLLCFFVLFSSRFQMLNNWFFGHVFLAAPIIVAGPFEGQPLWTGAADLP
jgi:hypothetical protein